MTTDKTTPRTLKDALDYLAKHGTAVDCFTVANPRNPDRQWVQVTTTMVNAAYSGRDVSPYGCFRLMVSKELYITWEYNNATPLAKKMVHDNILHYCEHTLGWTLRDSDLWTYEEIGATN